jgi:predicted nuclease of predicted toxin-antitoxin system
MHEATHPRDVGRLGEAHHAVFARCIAEDRVIATENAVDFRKLIARQGIHPGLIILPSVGRARSVQLLADALAWLFAAGKESDVIVNHVLEVSETGSFDMFSLSA